MSATSPGPRKLPVVPAQTGFADFQNDVLAGTREGDGKVADHEEAAHEKRNWVRLSYDCNNHCTFCLDSNAHDGTMRDNEAIKIQIVMGRRRGAERLILSGGEPTMHPNFLDFVKLGRLAGYPKIQTVTNGRMFRYPEFLRRAADSGLHEITFSLHGHNARLHDALVGTPGAFDEETAGLKAALASGRFIVNVDIVINKQNVRVLPEMLETFIGWGVREFDLLHIIPFGNAWSEAREHLFYDLDGNLPFLQQALAYARRPDIHVWLNRFPPPYAEGFEDLIQDPYKLNDEVRGRREEYDAYLSHGKKLHCRQPERCRHCYLEPLCDGLDAVLDARTRAEVDVLRVDAPPPPASVLPRARAIRVVARDAAAALALLAVSPPSPEVELDLVDSSGVAASLEAGARFGGRTLRRVWARDEAAARAALDLPEGVEVAIVLSRAIEPFVRASAPLPSRVVLVQPNHDRVTEAKAHDVELASLLAEVGGDHRVENVPACLAGRAVPSRPTVLDAAMLGADGRVDMAAFTRRFVADGFYTKALRCSSCAHDRTCQGVHVNWVRAHGFAPLAPLETRVGESPSSETRSASRPE